MSPDPLPFPDCFQQQEPAEIAAEIGEEAFQTLEDFVELREYLTDLVGDPDPFDASADEVGKERDRLAARLRSLGHILEAVAGWWVADQPPAFAPTCVSAVDAVAEAAAHLVVCLEQPMPRKALPEKGGPLIPVGLEVQCRYAAKTADTFDYKVAAAAIRCEVGVMARRPPPPTGSVRGFAPLCHQFMAIPGGFLSTHAALEMARGGIRQELPRGWDTMSDVQRLETLGVAGRPVTQLPTGDRPFVPHHSHRKILNALDGRAMVSSELEAATALEHSHMTRLINKLRTHGLVENIRGLGYYRPDSPPPELPPAARGGATE